MEVTLPLDKMNIAEKLRTMESLWDDLCQKAGNIPSPSWHQDVLQNREEDAQKGTDQFSDWETAKKKIRDSIS